MTIEIRDGVVAVDGATGPLITADYPYYRDHPAVWSDRLRALRDHTGIRIVSTYIPWRHHQPDAGKAPDFTGCLDPSRDLVGFLARCRDLGMRVIAKPGPFIHAETNYGGLPDWVCPSHAADIEPVIDAEGHPAVWSGARRRPDGGAEQWPLPAPLGGAFLDRVTGWLGAVGAQVLAPRQYPDGPVLMVQIGNEGLYTDAARPLWAYDYSEPALRFFRHYLRQRYATVAEYNRTHDRHIRTWDEVQPPRRWQAPAQLRGLLEYVDWGQFQADYLAQVYRLWSRALAPRVPVVVNINPPAGEDHAIDAWLARVRPRLWSGVHYGFTNWMGVVSADRAAHARYIIAAKRAPGPNLEENWGFAELYDRAYADAATSFHQTLLALAAGATGFNVYTGVATARWDDALDVLHDRPYPDCAPITADGAATAKVSTIRLLTDFFARHGAEFLACRPVTTTAWAIYPPYASIAAWAPADQDPTRCGRALREFHEEVRRSGGDYHLIDLDTATAADLAAHPNITLHAGPFLDRRVQRLLAGYVRAGGQLSLPGAVPYLDENLDPCTILAEAVTLALAATLALASLARETGTRVVAGMADVYLRIHPGRDVCYLTVLVDSANADTPIRLTLGDRHAVEITAAPGGAALLRIVDGRLDDFIVKGVNGYLDCALPASCLFDQQTYTVDRPADLARIGGRVSIVAAGQEHPTSAAPTGRFR